jgi:hypothetical protein
MSKYSNKWVAFPDVTEMTNGQIVAGWAGLPSGLDPESLQVNTSALKSGVINWGGYSAVTLVAYRGDTDQYSMGIGTDSGGNAYGTGTVSMSRAESSQLKSESDKHLNSQDIRNGSLDIQWNINALNCRIDTHEQYNPKIRAKQIDAEVRRATVKGILKHNTIDVINDNPPALVGVKSLVDGWLMTDIVRECLQEDYIDLTTSLGVRIMVLQGFIRFFRSNVYGVSFKDIVIDPFFWTVRPSKAAIGASIVASSKLVRPTPAKSYS